MGLKEQHPAKTYTGIAPVVSRVFLFPCSPPSHIKGRKTTVEHKSDGTQKTCGVFESPSSAKLLVDIRNGFQSCVEAIDAHLNFLSKVVLCEWDPTKFKWIQLEGPRGLYEKIHSQDNEDFTAMLQDLKAHDGKLTRDNYFYWLFQDQTTVGRKKRQ